MYMVRTTRLAAIWSKTARRSCLIGSFCKNIARLWNWETGKKTRIPSSASIKHGTLQQPAIQCVYHSDHYPTRQSASDPQDTLHLLQYLIPINFIGMSSISRTDHIIPFLGSARDTTSPPSPSLVISYQNPPAYAISDCTDQFRFLLILRNSNWMYHLLTLIYIGVIIGPFEVIV